MQPPANVVVIDELLDVYAYIDRREKNHQAYYGNTARRAARRYLIFKCARTRRSGAFSGQVRGDFTDRQIVSYVRGVGGPKMVRATCWSHSRRHFVDATMLNMLDAASISIVQLMDKLFAIDAQARNEKTDHTARHALRQEEAPSLLDGIHA
jgi:transposase